MTRDPNPRGRKRLQHHLEDQVDRDIDRYFGAGRARRRSHSRRQEQYARRAERLFDSVLRNELCDPALEGLELRRVEAHPNGGVLTLWVAAAPALEPLAQGLKARLREALARHLPRKRVPEVRIRVTPSVDDPKPGDEVQR